MAAMAAKGAFDLLLLESTGVSEPMQVGVVGQKEGGGWSPTGSFKLPNCNDVPYIREVVDRGSCRSSVRQAIVLLFRQFSAVHALLQCCSCTYHPYVGWDHWDL